MAQFMLRETSCYSDSFVIVPPDAWPCLLVMLPACCISHNSLQGRLTYEGFDPQGLSAKVKLPHTLLITAYMEIMN